MDIQLFREDRIILDLCGGSGSWSRPYKDAGYDVRLVTLPDQDVRDYVPPRQVYGILAAPPCTEFSLARNGHQEISRQFKDALSVVDACVRMAFVLRPVFFALENPIGYLGKWLGRHEYFFHPWWFGDKWTKRTCLWGWFNNPQRKYYRITDVMTSEEIKKCQENRYVPHGNGTRAERRAITPADFAGAFYKSNN